MKWLNRRRLPKSVYALIRQAEAEKESTLCLLFAQQPNPAGRQQKKKEKRGKCVDGMWGWGRDTDGVSRGHIFDFALYFVHAPSVLPLTPSPHMHNLLCADWHRQARIQFIAILWNPPPPREGIRGCPLQTCPLPHLFCSAIMFCQSQQQNGRSRKKNGKKGEKRVSISLQSSTWATFID